MKLPRTVYLIRHNKTHRMYIGSSCRPEERVKNHLYALRRGNHRVEDMQFDFDTYGEDFTVEWLEVITDYKDRMHEYDWMEKYKSHIRGVGYNYKDKLNLERVRTKTVYTNNKVKLLSLIKSLTDEEAGRFLRFLEKHGDPT